MHVGNIGIWFIWWYVDDDKIRFPGHRYIDIDVDAADAAAAADDDDDDDDG